MKLSIGTYIGVALAVVFSVFIVLGTFKPPTTESVQHGYRGTGMDLIYHRADLVSQVAANQLPTAIPKGDPTGQKAATVYQNLKVLGDLDIGEFNRTMASMAAWVAPTQSCNYCHSADGNFASDALYTKKVARRMLQMTRHVNVDWQKHVGKTGVTCYTCHRGQPVPSYVWYDQSGSGTGLGGVSVAAGDTGLGDPFPRYLEDKNEIRVVSNAVLPGTDRQSIKQTEGTYALMMHFSSALGVNCTYCHNTRSFMSWNQSTPQRNNAWYGIRMVRDLNANYLASLKDVFPKVRLGPHGDVPKTNCLTCHQGAYKPLFGAQMAKDYPALLDTKDVASAKPEEKKPEEKKPDEKKPEEKKPEEKKPEEKKPEEKKPDEKKPEEKKPEEKK